MFRIVLTILLTVAFSAVTSATDSVESLIKRATQQDRNVFVSEYLNEAFSRWQRRFPLGHFEVDSVFMKGAYDEVWVRRSGGRDRGERIALLVTKGAGRQIIDVRRLMLTEVAHFSTFERNVIEFVERFVWVYEIGDDSFLMDVLYPEYIMIRYGGFSEGKAVVSDLRADYRTSLPIRSIEWESEGSNFMVTLIVDSPLKPIQLQVDIQKYMTAQYFAMSDKIERVRELRDSTLAWLTTEQATPAAVSLKVEAVSIREALSKVLDSHFNAYDVSILELHKRRAIIEVSLPLLNGIPAFALRYELRFEQPARGEYWVVSSWLPPRYIDGDPFKRKKNDSQSEPEAIQLLRDNRIYALVNDMMHRYSSLGLPAIFQPETEVSGDFSGNLHMHTNRVDEYNIRNKAFLSRFLTGLAAGKLSYFFIRDIRRKGAEIEIVGYAVWPERERLWHHLARVEERFLLRDKHYHLVGADINLYPFIRTENVQALVALPNQSGKFKQQISIR